MQFDQATSIAIVGSAVALLTGLGAYLGTIIGGDGIGTVVGVLAGACFGVVLTYAADLYFLDEYNCIW